MRRDAVEERIVAPEAAYTLVDMMKGVIKRGTAGKAAGMPYFLAGKTGTTNDFRDAWFVGFSPQLLCLVWVGYDKDAFLGKRESGGTTALPIWMEFMSKALPLYPNEDFQVPEKEPVARYVYPPPGEAGSPETPAPAPGAPPRPRREAARRPRQAGPHPKQPEPDPLEVLQKSLVVFHTNLLGLVKICLTPTPFAATRRAK